jgi:SAM-dependent methyltransferase
MGDPEPERITDDAVDVTETAAVYAAEASQFVEKYRTKPIAERYGDAFRTVLPDPGERPPRVLDVGCGPGVDTEVFADAGLDAIGLDITRPFLREARDAVPEAAFLRGDMRHLPFAAGTVEGVWSIASFLHLPRGDASATLAEFGRVLTEGGALLLSVMARETRDVDAVELPDGRRFTFWREERLRERLTDAGFSVEALGEEEDWHVMRCVRE